MKSQKNTTIAMILALVVVGLFVALGFYGFRGSPQATTPIAQAPTAGAQSILDELSATGTVADLRTYDITVGDGAEATPGNIIVVHYTGVLPDGTEFDSSVKRGQPFAFQLGSGQVIQGWDKGFAGMKVGGQRLLAIPPSLGYGDRAVGSIPPNSTLIFQVELLQVLTPEEVQKAQAASAGE